MDVSTMVRDPKRVKETLIEKDGMLISSKGCKVYTPKRYVERKLASVGSEIKIVGVMTIVVEDKYYSVMKVPSMLTIQPSEILTEKVGDEEYFVFSFDPGSVLVTNLNIVMDIFLIYDLYNEIIAKGHVPWSFTYEDIGKLFAETKKYTGDSLSRTNTILEMIASTVSRNPNNLMEFYRHQIQTEAEEKKVNPRFIPFRSVLYGANNTTAKLLGAYFDDSLLSALVNPSERTEGVETILRS